MIKAHNGAIFNCDLVQQTPPDLRQKAMRVISGKYVIPSRDGVWLRRTGAHERVENGCWDFGRCTLAARVDSFHECSDGVFACLPVATCPFPLS